MIYIHIAEIVVCSQKASFSTSNIDQQTSHVLGLEFSLPTYRSYLYYSSVCFYLPTTGDGTVADGSVGSGSRVIGFPIA